MDEFVILQSKSKYAIYSNTTALYLYGFSNRIPIKYDITVKNGYKGSLQKEDNVNLFYTKKELLDLGVINYKLDSGNVIRVYDLDTDILLSNAANIKLWIKYLLGILVLNAKLDTFTFKLSLFLIIEVPQKYFLLCYKYSFS